MATTLRVLTGTPSRCKGLRNGCSCRSCKDKLTVLVSWRVHCEACNGDPERCREGQGEAGDFRRLTGCRAFTEEGKVRPKRAKPQPSQPWDVRPSRKAA